MAKFNLDIYIPYMGCPCGPSSPEQDKQSEVFQETLLALKNKYRDDISYMIYALNLHLQQFKARPELARILQNQGKQGLPVIFINDHPAFQGKYPGLDDLEKFLSSMDIVHD